MNTKRIKRQLIALESIESKIKNKGYTDSKGQKVELSQEQIQSLEKERDSLKNKLKIIK